MGREGIMALKTGEEKIEYHGDFSPSSLGRLGRRVGGRAYNVPAELTLIELPKGLSPL